MALSTASSIVYARDVTRALAARFMSRARNGSSLYQEIATVIQSDGEEEKYAGMGDMPQVREWVGDRLFNELRAWDYSLKNKLWELSMLISKLDIDDGKVVKYNNIIDGMAASARRHPDKLMFEVLVAGESTQCFDGQFFFDTDHSWGSSGTQSNDLTYAAATGTTPTVDEFRAAYNQAYAAMLGYKGDNGEPFFTPEQDENVARPLVLVPVALYPTAKQALETTMYDANNNPILVLGAPRVRSIAYLTDATKFYVLNTSQELKPFIFQERQPLRVQTKGIDDLEVKDIKFMTEARYNAGYGAWWNAVLTTFT